MDDPSFEVCVYPAGPTTSRSCCWPRVRQGRRTQLTDATTRAFFVFDRLDGLTVDELHHAADELSDLLLDRWPNCHLDRVERPPS